MNADKKIKLFQKRIRVNFFDEDHKISITL